MLSIKLFACQLNLKYMNSALQSGLRLFLAILIPLSVGAVASLLSMDAVHGWYKLAQKPSFTPPNWVFGPVWTVLYILMGIGLSQVWVSNDTDLKNRALLGFGVQLIANFLWTFLFFTLKSPLLAIFDCVILSGSIVWMIFSFFKIRPVIGILQIPYLLWSIFAALITFKIWLLNF
jgi:benzodiazapine receptor